MNKITEKKKLPVFIISWILYLFMIVGLAFPLICGRGEVETGFMFLIFKSELVSEDFIWARILIGLICWGILISAITFLVLSIISLLNGGDLKPKFNKITVILYGIYGLLGIIILFVCMSTYSSSDSFFTYSFIDTIIGVALFIVYKIINNKNSIDTQVIINVGDNADNSKDLLTQKPVFGNLIGKQKILNVYEDRVELIQIKNWKSFLTHDLFNGSKEIFFSSMVSVQIRKATNVIWGFLQFELPGSGTHNNFFSENSWSFRFDQNEIAQKIYLYIRNRIGETKSSKNIVDKSQSGVAEELREFKQLLDDGVITKEEFDKKKASLLK